MSWGSLMSPARSCPPQWSVSIAHTSEMARSGAALPSGVVVSSSILDEGLGQGGGVLAVVSGSKG